MAQHVGRQCPKCKSAMAVRGIRKEKNEGRAVERLHACLGCNHEEWQRTESQTLSERSPRSATRLS